MEETSKFNPRVDDQLKHETASLTHGSGVDAHARDDLRNQDPVGVPNPAERPDVPDAPGSAIPGADVEQRAELARLIAPAHFPAGREELVYVAEAAYAPDGIVGALRSLPGDQRFANIQEVWTALGGPTEGPHS